MKKEIHLAISITALVALLVVLAFLIYPQWSHDMRVEESVVGTSVIDVADDVRPDKVPTAVVTVEDGNIIRDNDVSQPTIETANGLTTYTYEPSQWAKGSLGISFTYPSEWGIGEETDGIRTVYLNSADFVIRIDQRGMGASPDWTYAYEIDGHPARTWKSQLEDGRYFLRVSPEGTSFIFSIYNNSTDFSEVDSFLSTVKFSQ